MLNQVCSYFHFIVIQIPSYIPQLRPRGAETTKLTLEPD
jgi:hypothetical protein